MPYNPRRDDDDGVSREEMDRRFVTLDRFTPIEKLVYGMVGLIAAGLVGLVFKAITRGGL